MHNRDKLWVSLLLAKYLQGRHIPQQGLSPGVLYVWRSIIRAKECLMYGFQLRVGRANISIWYDRWLPEDLLCNLVPYVAIHDTDLQLVDIYHNGSWDFSRLVTTYPRKFA